MRSTVIVGYDRTLASGRALLEAGREAACRDAEVTVVHAYHRLAEAAFRTGAEAHADEAAAAAAIAAFGAGVLRHRYPRLTVRGEAIAGAPHEVLAAAARGADLLILGSTGESGGAGQPLGPAAERTLARTPCPAMVVRNGERYPRGVVLAAIDIDGQAHEVLNFAFAEARFHSARLLAVSAFEPSGLRALVGARGQPSGPRTEAQAELDRILGERGARCAGVQASGEVVDGSPTAVLTAAAARADLVVVGARRRDGERRGVRIGPVTDALLRHAVCPVIVVPHF